MGDPLKVKCDECGEQPGDCCVEVSVGYDEHGDPHPEPCIAPPHAARVRAAEREEKGKEKGNG